MVTEFQSLSNTAGLIWAIGWDAVKQVVCRAALSALLQVRQGLQRLPRCRVMSFGQLLLVERVPTLTKYFNIGCFCPQTWKLFHRQRQPTADMFVIYNVHI